MAFVGINDIFGRGDNMDVLRWCWIALMLLFVNCAVMTKGQYEQDIEFAKTYGRIEGRSECLEAIRKIEKKIDMGFDRLYSKSVIIPIDKKQSALLSDENMKFFNYKYEEPTMPTMFLYWPHNLAYMINLPEPKIKYEWPNGLDFKIELDTINVKVKIK